MNTTTTMRPVPTDGWYREALWVLRAYYSARDDYEYHKTRSCVGTAAAEKRMWAAVAELERLGVIWVGLSMPTETEFEWGCGRRPDLGDGPVAGLARWRPRAGEPPPWERVDAAGGG